MQIKTMLNNPYILISRHLSAGITGAKSSLGFSPCDMLSSFDSAFAISPDFPDQSWTSADLSPQLSYFDWIL
jgi:hypothetical protein